MHDLPKSDLSVAPERNLTPSQPSVVAPETRNLERLSQDLAAWLLQQIPEASELRISNLSYPLGAGLSHETILFDAHWRTPAGPKSEGLVVRIKPTRQQVFLDDMFDQQFRIMAFMREQRVVPVAEPLWLETDSSLLGAPFFIMKKMSGRVAVSFPPYSKQGWLFDAAPADRRRLWEDAVRHMAAIQKVPVQQVQFLNLPGNFAEDFDQEIDRWTRYLEWADPKRECSLLRQQFEILQSRRPANRVEGIVWGDARLGNMMVNDDFRVVAVMDWEQPSLGGALQDLGWWLYTDRMQTVLRGLAPLQGMGSREETIALWTETSGKSAADIEWYEAFAAFKMECMSVRMRTIGLLPAAAVLPEPGTQARTMLELLGT